MRGKNPPAGARKNTPQKDPKISSPRIDGTLVIIKKLNLDLRFPRSWVYNIFVNEKGKKHLRRIALGGKFNEKITI